MSTENLSPQIIRQVMKELQQLTTSPPEGIKVRRDELRVGAWKTDDVSSCQDVDSCFLSFPIILLLFSLHIHSSPFPSFSFPPSSPSPFLLPLPPTSLPFPLLLFPFPLLPPIFTSSPSSSPPSHCDPSPARSKVATNEEDITEVRASIEGPVGTPYAEGLFRMKLVLGKDYPQAPPKGFFLTKIFHPNVSSTGEICVNVLKKDWKPDLGKAPWLEARADHDRIS